MAYILANDGISKAAEEKLVALGHTVDTNHYQGDDLVKKIKEVDCIVIRSATKIRVDLIDEAVKGGTLKLIIRAGVGIDNIDHVYAKEQGIAVRNTPNSSSDAVAELALGHMFALARNIYIANVTMRQGKWNKKQYAGIELTGKTLGLVGFGRIAQSLAKKAIALGMTVIYDDIAGANEAIEWAKFVGKDALLKQADFISLHIPFIKEVGPYFDEVAFDACKEGLYLVNTARGGVVSEAALLKALDSGKVAAAAIDVFEEEPTKNEELCAHDKVSLTPHIGAATNEAQDRIGDETIAVIQEYFV